jgi:hypothetical protein
VVHEKAQASTPVLALVAAARVAVGAVMILAPSRIFSPGSGTETLLMRTIGIRDVVLGSGACAAWARGEEGELKRWATVGLASDGADFVTGLRSKPLVGSKSAMIATLSPVPFVAAGILGLTRSLRWPWRKASPNDAVMIPPGANGQPTATDYRRTPVPVTSSALRAILMSCTDEDGGVMPIRRTTREARWRTFVQPS